MKSMLSKFVHDYRSAKALRNSIRPINLVAYVFAHVIIVSRYSRYEEDHIVGSSSAADPAGRGW